MTFSLLVIAALLLALPVVLGGLGHIAFIKLRWWSALSAVPLDGGLTLRGRRLFGANKTLRGALVMIVATAFSALACAGIVGDHVVVVEQVSSPLWWGTVLGTGYILGELPNSFLKRQLDIAPGAPAARGLGWFFWVVDQIDCLLGILVVAALAGAPLPLSIAVTLTVVALVLHPLLAGLMVLLGLKSRVG